VQQRLLKGREAAAIAVKMKTFGAIDAGKNIA
jgi:hypothetical protein